ncbi:hypothetical protein AMI01nite_51800 [Aneurinibacillus migulanus]|nr:hypothetical protein AMI01nite_51800 [Aneurinibacillus migulanus]
MIHKTRYKVGLITAESEASRYVRYRLDSIPLRLVCGSLFQIRRSLKS